MRRRPTAVYRVIDEDELLGGEALDGFHDAPDRLADRAATPWPAAVLGAPPRLTARLGWLPTAAAVGGLVCVALLLLSLSRHGEPVTPAALAGRHAQSPRAAAVLRRAAQRSSPSNARRGQSPRAPTVPRRAAQRSSRPNARAGYRRPLRVHSGPGSGHRSPRTPRGAPRRTVRPKAAPSRQSGGESAPAIAPASAVSAANREFGFER
jgi:hypothetical protein